MTPCTWIFVIDVNTVGSPVYKQFSHRIFFFLHILKEISVEKKFLQITQDSLMALPFWQKIGSNIRRPFVLQSEDMHMSQNTALIY
jgi:hypothetical protein